MNEAFENIDNALDAAFEWWVSDHLDGYGAAELGIAKAAWQAAMSEAARRLREYAKSEDDDADSDCRSKILGLAEKLDGLND